MGMYTEIIIKAKIQADDAMSEDVKMILNYLFNPNDKTEILNQDGTPISGITLPDHPFFETDRWWAIGRSSSYYHIPTTLNFFDGSYLFSRSDLKNYDYEIDLFFEWIQPYLNEDIGTCIGWSWYEETKEPTLHYKTR